VIFTKYRSRVRMKKNEMGATCSRYGGEKRSIQGCGLRGRDHFDVLGLQHLNVYLGRPGL